eukprot:297150-Rhodomonas_salina.2
MIPRCGPQDSLRRASAISLPPFLSPSLPPSHSIMSLTLPCGSSSSTRPACTAASLCVHTRPRRTPHSPFTRP